MSSLSISPAKAPSSSMQVDEEFKLSDITTLSKNALRDICDMSKAAEVKN